MGGDGEPLSDADARILGLESPAITGHTLNLMVLEPTDRPLDLYRLRSQVAGRLEGQPRATERVVHDADGPRDELFDLFHALGRLRHLGAAAQRLAGSAREFGVDVSNVPGPSSSVGVAGRRVVHLFSSSEPAMHHALRISATSCAGDIGIGLCTDPHALPDVAGLAGELDASFDELRMIALGDDAVGTRMNP